MKITVKFFSILKEIVGNPEQVMELQDNATVADLFTVLAEQHDIAPYRDTLRFALNREYVADTQTLTDGDEVALITPVAGG